MGHKRPRTRAGRLLLAALATTYGHDHWEAAIANVENEARAQEVDAILARLGRIVDPHRYRDEIHEPD